MHNMGRGKSYRFFFKLHSNRLQKCHRSYIYFMVKDPVTCSGNIYNSGGKETLSYHVKFYKIFELDLYSYK